MNVDEYLLRETLRQKGTVKELNGMAWALSGVKLFNNVYDVERVLQYSVQAITGVGTYRRIPVAFQNGKEGIPFESIPRAMANVLNFLDRSIWHVGEVDFACKEILEIHPFVDGNGRSVSILRNWLLKKLDDPEMLPYYFGEEE